MSTFRSFCVALLFLLLAGLALGCHYETNDDGLITLLLLGKAGPTPDLHLYFHGLGTGLAALYAWWPSVPWYGGLLYGLLAAATGLTFAVLAQLLLRRWSPAAVTAGLVLFFGLAWVEHGQWFNYIRVPLLLAPASIWWAAQRPGRRGPLLLGLLAFGVAWLIRPSAAVLGLLLAAPGAWWLSGWRSGPVLAGAVLLAGIGSLALYFSQPPPVAAYRRLDVLEAAFNDYSFRPPAPRSAPDRLGLQAARLRMLADSTLTNEALFQRAAPVAPGWFVRHALLPKAQALATQLVRDYFPLLLLLALSWALVGRGSGWRGFWLVQVGYAAALLALGLLLKLPPRLALPFLDAWLLANVAFLARYHRLPRRTGLLAGVLLVGVGVLYSYKVWHRRQVLATEQRAQVAQLRRLTAGQPALLVGQGLESSFKSLSPFGDELYELPLLLLLSGWHTPDPSQAAWRRQLTGTRSVSVGIRRLAARGAAVRWVLTPEGAAILNRQLAHARPAGAPHLALRPVQPLPAAPPDQAQVYAPYVESGK